MRTASGAQFWKRDEVREKAPDDRVILELTFGGVVCNMKRNKRVVPYLELSTVGIRSLTRKFTVKLDWAPGISECHLVDLCRPAAEVALVRGGAATRLRHCRASDSIQAIQPRIGLFGISFLPPNDSFP